MRFIDQHKTFYSLIGMNLLALTIACILFYSTSAHPSTFILPLLLVALVYTADVIFVWLAFTKNSIIKMYYLIFPAFLCLLFAIVWL